jgi:glycerol-3-phosphate dehydrogenase (NAD(P)+)
MSHNIAILGGGSWGIAVANLLNMNGSNTAIWEFDREDYENLLREREHSIKLPGIVLPREISIHNDLSQAVEGREIICLAIPSDTVRQVCDKLNDIPLKTGTIIVNLAKGIEIDTLMRMSEVITEEIDTASADDIVTLSGPSHAEEVARGMPTSVVAGCERLATAELVRDTFSNQFFRAYSSPDIIGVEIGGALKNIIAIAAGIADGLGGGDNAKGALFTRGIAEISRLGEAMGANPMTFSGLSGLGDLVTTCISRFSRNRAFGEKIGQGKSLETALSEMTMVVEGIKTTRAAHSLMRKFGIEMPIAKQVYEVLFEQKNPREALLELMKRDLKSEI